MAPSSKDIWRISARSGAAPEVPGCRCTVSPSRKWQPAGARPWSSTAPADRERAVPAARAVLAREGIAARLA